MGPPEDWAILSESTNHAKLVIKKHTEVLRAQFGGERMHPPEEGTWHAPSQWKRDI
jgi:hypothetical protein